MGLTGVILDATFDLIPVETSLISVDEERCADLDHLMASMSERDDRYRYSVAWIDCTARGRSLGRGILGRGDHATLDELPKAKRTHARRFAPQPLAVAPPLMPTGLINLHDDARVQRGLVPQGAQAPHRRPVDLGVLPPARPGRRLEPDVRQPRLHPVPVRRAVRRRVDGALLARGAERHGHAVVPRGAQALRRAEPRDALVPEPGLDARGRHPGRATPSCPACSTGSTTPCSKPAAACTWPRTPAPGPSTSASCTPGSPSGARSGPSSTPTA